MSVAKGIITTLIAFVKRAEKLGAWLTDFTPDRDEGFAAWVSPSNGGCGSTGCRCSPGLWISVSEGARGVTAHFGADFERGGEGTFDDRDIDAWRKLRAAIEPRARG